MVLVTTFVRSGRVSNCLLVRRIGCAVHHQPDPVGLGLARRMPNKLRKRRMRHRRQDRLCGATPPSHGGHHRSTWTTLVSTRRPPEEHAVGTP